HNVYATPSNRILAVGGTGASMPRITKKRGELSNRHGIPEEVLTAAGNPKGDQLGFFESWVGDQIICRETTWTAQHPEVKAGGMQFFQMLDAVYRSELADEYAEQLAEVEKIPPELRLTEVFTTVTVNKNLRTFPHRDAGDLKAGTGVMATLGNFAGGYLAFPEYGVAVDYQPGDILLADVHLLHGNFRLSGERVTAILYAREDMHLCPR
ncbi:MAG: hypothetical protein M3O09_03300, partial [Acidobacteriota bacterium]|nr:hypothetical protein [Acidobacteriota bacterium]